MARRRPHPASFGHVGPNARGQRRARAADRAGGFDVCRLTVGLVGLSAYFAAPVALVYWLTVKVVAPLGSHLLALGG